MPGLEDDGERVSGLYHLDTKSIEVDPDDPEPWATLLKEAVHDALDISGVAQVLTLVVFSTLTNSSSVMTSL